MLPCLGRTRLPGKTRLLRLRGGQNGMFLFGWLAQTGLCWLGRNGRRIDAIPSQPLTGSGLAADRDVSHPKLEPEGCSEISS